MCAKGILKVVHPRGAEALEFVVHGDENSKVVGRAIEENAPGATLAALVPMAVIIAPTTP